MNKFSLNDLKNSLNIIGTMNVDESTVFDHLRITAIEDKKYERIAKNILFFPVTLSEQMVKDGWIINSNDLREKINDIIANNSQLTFLVEESMLEHIKDKNAKLIVVDSIMNSIDLLYKRIISERRAKTIAITGSVGKTTAVGLVEDILKTKYKVLRIYSKRITPLILKTFIINLLDDSYDFIVLEMSLFYRHHVKALSELLPPYIAALINIDSCHIGVDEQYTYDDLCKNKAEIFRHAQHGYYNTHDETIAKLSYQDNSLAFDNTKLFEGKMEGFFPIIQNAEIKDNELLIGGLKCTPYILTKLSVAQYSLAFNIASKLGIDLPTIVETANNYIPVENRLNKAIAFNKEIIFDGDISTVGRMKQLASHYYDKAYLVLRKMGCSEEDVHMENFYNYLFSFTKVFLFEDSEYYEELKGHPNVISVTNHDFMDVVDGAIFYHYSGYFRVFREFDEKNLIDIDKKEYVIYRDKGVVKK